MIKELNSDGETTMGGRVHRDGFELERPESGMKARFLWKS